jgi:hypothetical protein
MAQVTVILYSIRSWGFVMVNITSYGSDNRNSVNPTLVAKQHSVGVVAHCLELPHSVTDCNDVLHPCGINHSRSVLVHGCVAFGMRGTLIRPAALSPVLNQVSYAATVHLRGIDHSRSFLVHGCVAFGTRGTLILNQVSYAPSVHVPDGGNWVHSRVNNVVNRFLCSAEVKATADCSISSNQTCRPR